MFERRKVDERALKRQILKLTADFRDGREVIWQDMRELLKARAIDCATCVLAQLHTEDKNRWLGIVVTKDRRVFWFLFDHHRSGETSELAAWEELTGKSTHIEYRAFVNEIEGALNLVRRHAHDADAGPH
jgi:hypothetical protein